jgi:hypothetical protein
MSIPNQKVGQYYALSVGSGGSPETWTPVACLSKKELTINNQVIDATSDCGPNYLPGFANNKLSLSGFIDFNNAATVSGDDFIDYATNQLLKFWNISPVETPVQGDITLVFNGFITNLKIGMSTNNMVSFDCDVQINGNVSKFVTA